MNLPVHAASLEVFTNSTETQAARPIVPRQIYEPIEEWQARVLELIPDAEGEYLRCNLLTVDMIQAEGVVIHGTRTRIQYFALSYSWGHHLPTHPVTCNGETCFISNQLATALRLLRKRGHRYIFVDCFCINQNDVAEKNSQVQGMFEIFAKATAVLVWLGDATTATTICELSTQLTSNKMSGMDEADSWDEEMRLSMELAANLTVCPWFQRTW
jgi:hypothetical protein